MLSDAGYVRQKIENTGTLPPYPAPPIGNPVIYIEFIPLSTPASQATS